MKSIKKILMAISILLSFTACNAKIQNAKTETVKIYGNCHICKTTIENAGNRKNLAAVEWDKDTKMAFLTFDAKKTNTDEILKRIALSGYDSDKYLAPDRVYASLADCCKYDRVNKATEKPEKQDDNSHEKMGKEIAVEPMQDKNELKAVFENYFALKDALVATNGQIASAKALELKKAINAVKMNELEMNVHMVWMKVLKDLNSDTEHIATTKETDHQRDHFMALSKNMYELMKIAKVDSPVYYQYCPMANDNKGANWLSKESSIKNPYFGSQMLTCGKTVETLIK